MIPRCSRLALAVIPVTVFAAPVAAQGVPTINTEDATLGSADTVSEGRVHAQLSFDVRNGYFARGAYDDDRADLDRLPVHIQAGAGVELSRDAAGKATSWLVLRSNNGFHSPDAGETTSPRSWYESNNLAALIFTPAAGLRAAAVYTIKTSPNGVSPTTHEASLSFAYRGAGAAGTLAPTLAISVRPKGNHGVFTQAGIEPSFDLSQRDDGPSLSLPIAAGIGWSGFYGEGSGDRKYMRAGAAIEQPFTLGGAQWAARAEAVAMVRDKRLARLSGPDGEAGRVVPLVTMSVSLAY